MASVYRIPEDLDLDTAVLTEPLAVAVHGIGRVPLKHGDEVLVLGGGTIGLLTAFVAAQRGCTVTISVRHPHQRRLARLFGSSRIVSSNREAILDVFQETRFDVVFETVGGKATTIDVALASVREGGSIVVLGLFNKPVTLDPVPFLAKEVRIVSSMMYSRNGRVPDFVAALEILQNERKRLSALITHHVSLEAIDDGFSLASDKRSGAIKVCVDMSQKL
jgi:2-desacetyl-2-hydroxyethyl bacteriochlorophyllide A dehydrogenase